MQLQRQCRGSVPKAKKSYSDCAAAVHERGPRAAVLLNVGVFWCCHWCFGKGSTHSLPYSFLLEKWFISSSNCSDTKWQLPEWASFITCGWVIGEGGRPAFPPAERRLLQFSFVLSSRGEAHMWSSLVTLLWNVSKPLDCNSSTQRGGGSKKGGREGGRNEAAGTVPVKSRHGWRFSFFFFPPLSFLFSVLCVFF